MKSPDISVVIPTLNGGATIAACLDGIFAQTVRDRLEVIVIDSGSRDDTLDIVRRYPVEIKQIAPTEFNHGETRNLGVRLAKGEFVAMTVQDARPVDDQWLERMLKHFEDPRVAGVCGQQVVPREPDTNPLQWFRPYSEPVPRKIWFPNEDEFGQLTAAETVALCGWDNVTSIYRRSAHLELPFRHVGFCEDLVWAQDALRAGHALVYDYSARVYHYHAENFSFRFRRQFTISYHLYQHSGHLTMPPWILPELARCVRRVVRRKYCPSRRMHWLIYNLRLALAEWLARWIFWLKAKLGGTNSVERLHGRWCAAPPQPIRTR